MSWRPRRARGRRSQPPSRPPRPAPTARPHAPRPHPAPLPRVSSDLLPLASDPALHAQTAFRTATAQISRARNNLEYEQRSGDPAAAIEGKEAELEQVGLRPGTRAVACVRVVGG